MVPHHREQVPQAALNVPDALDVFGQPTSKFPEALRLELLVVHNYASALIQGVRQRGDESTTWIASVHRQKLTVLDWRTRFPASALAP